MYKKLTIILFIILMVITGGCTNENHGNRILTVGVEGNGKVITDKTESSKDKIIDLIPVSEEGWVFQEWKGKNGGEVEYNNDDNIWEIILNGDKILIAVFVPEEYTLNINIEGQGIVIKEILATANESNFEFGTRVRLSAQPDENWCFSYWEGDLDSKNNPEEILVDSEKNITAVFEESPSISGNITVDYGFAAVNSNYRTESTEVIINQQKRNNITDEMIVGFSPHITGEEREDIINNINGDLIKFIEPLNAAVIKVSDNVQDKMVQVQSISGIRYSEPNNRVLATDARVPNDPLYSSQWNYRLIDLPFAWSYETGNNNIRIAVLDTGIAVNHSDLYGRIDFENGYNFISGTVDVTDDHGHGTHVAGILGAVTNNNEGIAGTTWNSEILPLKVLNENGSGSYSDIAEGVLYAAGILEQPSNPDPVDIINMSLGGYTDSDLLKDAITLAHEEGIFIVASSGNNDESELLYPARYPETIAVGAVDCTGERADYSNYGSELDVVAPGGSQYYGVLSTYLNNGYDTMAGTSVAAPHVSGLISLMLANGTSPADIRNTLHRTSIHPGQKVFSEELGYGLINTNFALNDISEIKVILGNRHGDTIEKVAKTTVSINGGSYSFNQVPAGEYSVFAWIDITEDNIINSGDYIQESNLIEFKPKNQYQQDLIIYIE